MDVVIAGGHGQIALRLERLLSGAGHRARALIRNPDHAADVEAAGGDPVVCDLEVAGDLTDLTEAVKGADAVVFAAGAGPGSGADRKRTVDYGGAVKLMEAALSHDIRRYVMVSAIGANHPERWTDEMRPYYEAKAEADKIVSESRLDYTIVRPGGLTDQPGTGKVRIAEQLETGGSVSRDDVAAVIAEVLVADNTIGTSFDLLGGETPIPEAVRSV